MSGVPTYIEFSPSQFEHDGAIMDYDADIECISMASTEHGDDFTLENYATPVEQQQQEPALVSHKDLDAMKQMIFQMRQNPELLHQSPVYSKSVLSCSNSDYNCQYQEQQFFQDAPYGALERYQQCPGAGAAAVSSSSLDVSNRTDWTWMTKNTPSAMITPVTQKDSLYVCQECSAATTTNNTSVREAGSSSGYRFTRSSSPSRGPTINFMSVSRSPPPKPSVQKLNVLKLVANAPPLPFR